MGCLHSTGATSAQHDEALFGEALAQKHHLLIHRVGALQGVSSHDAQAKAWIMLLEELVKSHVNAMVVQGTRQRLFHVLRLFARCDEVTINLCVIAGLESGLVSRIIAGIEFVGCVKRGSVNIERHSLQVLHSLWREQFSYILCINSHC